MKIAFIGANSFLASYCVQAFQNHSSLHLWSRNVPENSGNHKHHLFVLPEQSPKVSDLLDFDAILYFASAGYSPGKMLL